MSNPIPSGWAAAHQPIVTATMDCAVRIGPAGGARSFNTQLGRTQVAVLPPVYAGRASIGSASVNGSSENQRLRAGDDAVDIHAYLIRLPASAAGVDEIEIDHVVTVESAPSGALVGARLIVTGIAEPSREFSRSITARLHE